MATDLIRLDAELMIRDKLGCSLPREQAAAQYPKSDGRRPVPAGKARATASPRLARLILIALALIGVVAIALLVLGLMNVRAVTEHFRIH